MSQFPRVLSQRGFKPILLSLPITAFAVLLFFCLRGVEKTAFLLPHFWMQAIYGAMLILTPFILWRARRRDATISAWWGVDIVVCTYFFVPILQLTLPFPRPENSPLGELYGFPSGHSVSSWAAAILILRASPTLAPLWFALAIWVGVTRLQTDAHFGWQIWSGALIGMILGWAQTRLRSGILVPRAIQSLRKKRPGGLT